MDDVEAVDLVAVGPGLEHHPLFPERANISIAQMRGRNAIRVRVWERGVGISQACGTGATAAAVRAHQWGLVDREVQVQMPGGVVQVLVGEEPILIGPAEYVGAIEISV